MKRNTRQTDLSSLDEIFKGIVVSLTKFILKPLFSATFQIRRLIYRAIGEWFSFADDFLFGNSIFIINKDESNPFSKLLRPWFEHQRIRGIIGINLIFSLIIFSLIGSPASAKSNLAFATFSSNINVNSSENIDISVVEAPKEAVVTTEKRFQLPVNLIGVSQGYQDYHPGIDLRAEYGSAINPIAEGLVLDVYRSKYGYGQSIYIDHADGYSSLYAHVQRISVEAGSDVDQKTVIAEVGLTGFTTGPHLHLEIYKEGKSVNPRYFFEY